MKRTGLLYLLMVLFLSVSLTSTYAQTGRGGSKKKKTRTEMTKRPEDSSPFLDRLWAGANMADFAIFGNVFVLGVTPVVAFEVNEFLMIGPFARMAYRYERVEGIKLSTFDIGPGVFVRGTVLQNFFLQADYESAFFEQPVCCPYQRDGNNLVTEKIQQNYLYLGLGYTSGSYNSQFTMSLHYNVLDEIDYVRFPFDIRIGMLFRIGRSGQDSQLIPSDR